MTLDEIKEQKRLVISILSECQIEIRDFKKLYKKKKIEFNQLIVAETSLKYPDLSKCSCGGNPMVIQDTDEWIVQCSNEEHENSKFSYVFDESDGEHASDLAKISLFGAWNEFHEEINDTFE